MLGQERRRLTARRALSPEADPSDSLLEWAVLRETLALPKAAEVPSSKASRSA